jgi:hypothetical protein
MECGGWKLSIGDPANPVKAGIVLGDEECNFADGGLVHALFGVDGGRS